MVFAGMGAPARARPLMHFPNTNQRQCPMALGYGCLLVIVTNISNMLVKFLHNNTLQRCPEVPAHAQ